MKSENVSEFYPGVGVDIGTANIVVSRQKLDGSFVNFHHRNMLYPLQKNAETLELLARSDYLYVEVEDRIYVVGEDALRLVSAIGSGEVVRPMSNGILNPTLKESAELLFFIIKAVVGEPICANEPLRFSVPANPVDAQLDNLFHKMILTQFFNSIGYAAQAINEAMCVAYDCNPVLKNEDGEIPISGIVCSCGAGMWNIALCYKGMSIVEFSCTKSGDYLDEQTAKVTGAQKSKVIRVKEKELNLLQPNFSDRISTALSIYYDELIARMVHHIKTQFADRGSSVDSECEFVFAGGVSMAPGFIEKVATAIAASNFPVKISNVRHSKTPFYSVAQGAAIRARADGMK
jgi:actin-like ATPase involved in cell morphogenesis